MTDRSAQVTGDALSVKPTSNQATAVALAELARWRKSFDAGKETTIAGILPFLIKFRGKPYSLNEYFIWDFMFNIKKPYLSVTKCGRQQGKTLCLGVEHAIFPAVIPHYNMLYVSPRAEQTRTFSQDNLSPLLRHSPYTKNLLKHPDAVDNQLHKYFPETGSNIYCSYAMDSGDRIRSKTARRVSIDEGQDVMREVIDVVLEVMSAQKEATWQMSGTPKTLDNTLEHYWRKTSMAEWAIKCTACNHTNVCSVEYDLLKMIPDQGLSCAKCGRLVNPRVGCFIHRYPGRRGEAEGHHVPQCVLPIHCEPTWNAEDRKYVQNTKWRIFCRARDAGDTATFYNEKLGESYDSADTLISTDDLSANSVLPFNNKRSEAAIHRKKHRYNRVIMGLDWGGGGMSAISRTGISVIGFNGLSRPADVLFQCRYVKPLRGFEEAEEILRVFTELDCDYLAHDFCGAGATKEVLLTELGLPLERNIPVEYVGYRRGYMIVPVLADELNPRDKIQAIRTQTLGVMAALIQTGFYRFPRFASWQEGIASCYTSILREKRGARAVGPSYHIFTMAERADDVAMATNYASIAYWNEMGGTPSLGTFNPSTERGPALGGQPLPQPV